MEVCTTKLKIWNKSSWNSQPWGKEDVRSSSTKEKDEEMRVEGKQHSYLLDRSHPPHEFGLLSPFTSVHFAPFQIGDQFLLRVIHHR